MKFRTVSVLVLAAVCIMMVVGSASAVTNPFAVEFAAGASSNTWVYTLTNLDTTDQARPDVLTLYWDAAMSSGVAVEILGSAEDWGAQDIPSGNAYAEWQFFGVDRLAYGMSDTGFEISSTAPMEWFQVTYHKGSDFSNYYESSTDKATEGQAIPAPEPGTMCALLVGLGSLGLPLIRRRR